MRICNRIIAFLISILIVVSLTSCNNKSEQMPGMTEKDKADAYIQAEAHLNEGNTSAAMFYYAVAGDNKDARAQYNALYGQLNSVAACGNFSLGIQSNGTVVAASYGTNNKIDVSNFTDLMAVSPTGFNTFLGITRSGNVVFIGEQPGKQFDFSSWKDIIAVSSAGRYHLGVTSSHRVISLAENAKDYKKILKTTEGWRDIFSVAAGPTHAVGLRRDGTVVAVGENEHKQCNVDEWTDIVAVAAGSFHTVGLKGNGTVVATGYNNSRQCEVSGWKDIIAILASEFYTIGLKKNGSVLIAGVHELSKNMLAEVSSWKDVIAISATSNALGVRKDGTVLAAGGNYYSRMDVDDWKVQVSGQTGSRIVLKQSGSGSQNPSNKEKGTAAKVMPEDFSDKITGNYIEEYTYIYGKKDRSDSLFKSKFIPKIELKNDHTFVFTINYFEGIANLTGVWKLDEKANNKIHMYSKEGADAELMKEFSLELISDTDVIYHGPKVGTVNEGNIYKKQIEIEREQLVNHDSASGQSAANLNNNPWVASDGEWIYFNSTYGLYKVRKDGGERIKLTAMDATMLNVVGGWIYFCNQNSTFNLYRMRTDGSEITKLTDEPTNEPRVLGDWIYYAPKIKKGNASYSYIYKMRTDGSEKTKISDDDGMFLNIVDDWIYFSNGHGPDAFRIHKMHLDGSGKVQLNKDKSFNIYVLDGWIYYLNGTDYYKLYKMRTDGSGNTAISQTNNVENFNVVNGWVYFVTRMNQLYKVRINGSDEAMIKTKRAASEPIVIDGWIYYDYLDRIRIDGTQDQSFGAYRGAGEWDNE